MNAEDLIRRYRLEPHPEGGWYREVHRSTAEITRPDGRRRAALTAILFLLQADECSCWHRVSDADETWHHAGGAPLELLCLPPGCGVVQRRLLASLAGEASGGEGEMAQGEPLGIVPAGWWQAARSLGRWSLVSCCVGPGFDFADFTLLRHRPLQEWPQGTLTDFL